MGHLILQTFPGNPLADFVQSNCEMCVQALASDRVIRGVHMHANNAMVHILYAFLTQGF